MTSFISNTDRNRRVGGRGVKRRLMMINRKGLPMTFEEFKATKVRKTREAFAADIGLHADGFTSKHVLTYFDGSVHIEDDEGKGFYLCLECDEWFDADLETLERRLFEWCDDYGFF